MSQSLASLSIEIIEDIAILEGEGGELRLTKYQRYKERWVNGHYISKGMSGTWSKHGGSRLSAVKEEVQERWNCQSCGKLQPKILSPYLWELDDKEFIRVCAICLAQDCAPLKKRLERGDSF